MADIVKHTFTKKDLETRNLQQRLYDAESNLSKVTRDMNINVNNLKVKLNEKCRIMQEIERQRANTKKVCPTCLQLYYYFCAIGYNFNCIKR